MGNCGVLGNGGVFAGNGHQIDAGSGHRNVDRPDLRQANLVNFAYTGNIPRTQRIDQPMTHALLKTTNQKHLIIARILAGGPLLMFGAMHLSGAMPIKPLVEAANLPMPAVAAGVAPLAMILAGVLLLSGTAARLGGIAAIATMLTALITHLKIPNDQWPTPSEADPSIMVPGAEPTFMMGLAAVILLASAYIVFKGAGAWSVDGKITGPDGCCGSNGCCGSKTDSE